MTIVVFGSINMDMVVRVPRLPARGETLTGHTFFTAPGGKGANQAVACARLSVPTRMVGRVGDDVFGVALRESLREYGVDVGAVETTPGPSGVAAIAVDDSAENTIVVIPGANGAINRSDVQRLGSVLEGVRAVLLQFEIPLDAVIAGAQVARERGVTVILDPAPAQPIPDSLYSLTDIITPNESEATALTGIPIHDEADAARAAQALLARGVGQVIIKLGGRGAYLEGRYASGMRPAFRVTPVDTVAAGDAFNGGLAAGLSQGLSFDEALRWGMAAGGLSTTRTGAQQSMPDRTALIELLESAH